MGQFFKGGKVDLKRILNFERIEYLFERNLNLCDGVIFRNYVFFIKELEFQSKRRQIDGVKLIKLYVFLVYFIYFDVIVIVICFLFMERGVYWLRYLECSRGVQKYLEGWLGFRIVLVDGIYQQ